MRKRTSSISKKAPRSNLYQLHAEIVDAVSNIYGELQLARAAQSFTTFRIPAEQLHIVELAGDQVCKICGLNSSPACDMCPLDKLFARLGEL